MKYEFAIDAVVEENNKGIFCTIKLGPLFDFETAVKLMHELRGYAETELELEPMEDERPKLQLVKG